jgi:hypothetical protein
LATTSTSLVKIMALCIWEGFNMPDIAMCKNPNCEIKNTCYRFLAKPDDMQSYVVIDAVVKNKADCELYWEVERRLNGYSTQRRVDD